VTGAATTSKEAEVTSSSLIKTSSKSDQGMVIAEIPGDMIGNNPDNLLEYAKVAGYMAERTKSGGVQYHLTPKQQMKKTRYAINVNFPYN
jgi:hypothetical protein